MSGTKTYTVKAGISTVREVDISGSAAGATLVSMTVKAYAAYQQRKRRDREVAIQREQAIQQKIAQIRAGVGSSANQSKVSVQLPKTGDSQLNQAAAKDAQRRVQELKSQLPKIRAEYQVLIDQQLLDTQSVQQALQQTEEALNGNNFVAAQTYLQALDDARIQVIQRAKAQWRDQVEYLRERLDALRPRLPQTINQQMQIRIDEVSNNWQQLSVADIQTVHQLLSEFEAQAEQVQEAAANLAASWSQAGYVTHDLQIDDGDVVIEIETHDGVNTQMRVQFDGQQIELEGPHDEAGAASCAGRTMEVMQRFQEQGYQLEWKEWNGEAVDQESPQGTESLVSPSPQRRLEGQGY